jgi:hypothetical protein
MTTIPITTNNYEQQKLFFKVYLIFMITVVSLFYLHSEQTNQTIHSMIMDDESHNHRTKVATTASEATTITAAATATSDPLINFAIAGFPKCSTTFLRNSLLSSTNKTFFGNNKNEIHLLSESSDHNKNAISEFKELYAGHKMTKNGFKCPDLLYSEVGLGNLETHFPQTDLIVSVRHPVLWFQSFYNYRIRKGNAMPKPQHLIGKCPSSRTRTIVTGNENDWSNLKDGILNHDDPFLIRGNPHKLCTDRSRFHFALSRLGKTPMNSTDELELLHYHKLKVHNFPKNRIFLMEIGQLSVENRTRADQFVDDLVDFLHLRDDNNDVYDDDGVSNEDGEEGRKKRTILHPLEEHTPMHGLAPKTNIKTLDSKLIDICSSEYQELRKALVDIGREASEWILRYFLEASASDDGAVVVSDRGHFEELVTAWRVDPCLSSTREEKKETRLGNN